MGTVCGSPLYEVPLVSNESNESKAIKFFEISICKPIFYLCTVVMKSLKSIIFENLVEHVLFRLVQIQSKLTSVWTCLGQVLDASKTCPGHCIISWCQSQDMDTCCRTCGTDDAIKELTCYNIHSTG